MQKHLLYMQEYKQKFDSETQLCIHQTTVSQYPGLPTSKIRAGRAQELVDAAVYCTLKISPGK